MQTTTQTPENEPSEPKPSKKGCVQDLSCGALWAACHDLQEEQATALYQGRMGAYARLTRVFEWVSDELRMRGERVPQLPEGRDELDWQAVRDECQ